MTEKNEIIHSLLIEKSKLESTIMKIERRLEKVPDGSVRIHKHGKGYQYYLRLDPKDKYGIYIPAFEKKKAFDLIQKKYDQKILFKAKEQLNVIQTFLKKYDPDSLKEVYDSLSEARKQIVDPVDLPDDVYAELWQKSEYEHKIISESTPSHYTQKGERVRSKSEVIIANALFHAGVPYRYEYPLELNGYCIHPDFTVLRVRDRREFLWEHLGMLDDSEYRNNALQRIVLYEKEGIFPGEDLLITFETLRQPLNMVVVNRIIKHYLL